MSKGLGGLTRISVLCAVIVLMAFTPLGYLRVSFVSVTFLMIPVAIAGVVLGPVYGAVAGGVFGVTSFVQCFGMDVFGTGLFSISPVSAFLLCLVPRVLAGWLSGLLFRGLGRFGVKQTVCAGSACFSASFLNTALFVTVLVVLFRPDRLILFFTELGIITEGAAGGTVLMIVTALVTYNALLEALACTLIGLAVSRALLRVRT